MKKSRCYRDTLAISLLVATAMTTAGGQESNEIRCRGGGFGYDTVGTRIDSSGETILTISFQFFNTASWVPIEHVSDSLVTGGYFGLTPPGCAWVSDGDGSSYQAIRSTRAIRFETPANAQLKQKLHGSEVDTSPTAAERYPDARSIQEYMLDPNHYWSFFIESVVTSGTPYFVASGHGYFKPPRAVLSPDDFKARKPTRSIPSTIDATETASATTTQAANATPTQTTRSTAPTTNSTVRALPRVRLPGPTTPTSTLTKCQAAERARARNSPAAPGLEASCRAEKALEVTAVTETAPAVTVMQPENTIKVRVAYRKELGYKGDTGPFGYIGPTSCDAFSVSVAPRDGSEQRELYRVSSDFKMDESSGYYVCNYLVSYVPLDQAMAVSVSMSAFNSSAAWKGSDAAQPPPGQQRTILDATKTALLNATQPRARLSYQMVYAPVTQH